MTFVNVGIRSLRYFLEADKDGNGTLDTNEIGTAFDKVRQDMSLPNKFSPEELITKFDVNGDGLVTQKEFSSKAVEIAEELRLSIAPEIREEIEHLSSLTDFIIDEGVYQAYYREDKDKSDSLDAKELPSAVSMMFKNLNLDENACKSLITLPEYDVNEKGKVPFLDFFSRSHDYFTRYTATRLKDIIS
ncbi:EF-hand domain-containing protein [Candidatus Hepatobacter penaei]|uniref:EF-hand domain-containing protein n=1 Tax=Candidatus Hepatobacter penaei TaxID=1274402 RepID=UPI00155AB698|nr:EF-hand domain-containing protein [Candidatus Hepatobacter penaei]